MDPKLAFPSRSEGSALNEYHFYQVSLKIQKPTDKEDYLYTIQGYHVLNAKYMNNRYTVITPIL